MSQIYSSESLTTDKKSKLLKLEYRTRLFESIDRIKKLLKVNPKIIFRKLGREQAYGLFHPVGDGIIEIDPRQQTVKSVIRAICHEMVHVHQFKRGDFWQDGNLSFWMQNNEVIYFTNNQLAKMHYRAIPWEKEAYNLEPKIYNSILKQ